MKQRKPMFGFELTLTCRSIHM